MFNQNGLNNFDQQKYERENEHREQQENIRNLVKAAHDFIDAAQKIKPEYQAQAQQAVFGVIVGRMINSCQGV